MVALLPCACVYVQELRAFSSLLYSKNKALAALDWHPKKKGMLAVAPTRNLNFNQKIDIDGMVRLESDKNARKVARLTLWSVSLPCRCRLPTSWCGTSWTSARRSSCCRCVSATTHDRYIATDNDYMFSDATITPMPLCLMRLGIMNVLTLISRCHTPKECLSRLTLEVAVSCCSHRKRCIPSVSTPHGPT